MASSLEAKIVVLGAQGVGKTSLLLRYIKNQFNPSTTTSTVGASFLTKRVLDPESDTLVRLQIWDTAGQERFRSISRLYYRGANACILCYSITSLKSFEEMSVWLTELRRNLPADIILHVVGTKADLVAREPKEREVPFERCIAYVAENLAPGVGGTPPATAMGREPGSGGGGLWGLGGGGAAGDRGSYEGRGMGNIWGGAGAGLGPEGARSPSSKRSSGFWGMEVGWDCCHEVSAESGEGVEEVFRVITRKLVEQNARIRGELLSAAQTPGTGYDEGVTPGTGGMGSEGGYFDGMQFMNRNMRPGGSFRVGRDRRSWLGGLTGLSAGNSELVVGERERERIRIEEEEARKRGQAKGRCC